MQRTNYQYRRNQYGNKNSNADKKDNQKSSNKSKIAFAELSDKFVIKNSFHKGVDKNVIWNGGGTATEWFQAKSRIKTAIIENGGKIEFLDMTRVIDDPINGPWTEDKFNLPEPNRTVEVEDRMNQLIQELTINKNIITDRLTTIIDNIHNNENVQPGDMRIYIEKRENAEDKFRDDLFKINNNNRTQLETKFEAKQKFWSEQKEKHEKNLLATMKILDEVLSEGVKSTIREYMNNKEVNRAWRYLESIYNNLDRNNNSTNIIDELSNLEYNPEKHLFSEFIEHLESLFLYMNNNTDIKMGNMGQCQFLMKALKKGSTKFWSVIEFCKNSSTLITYDALKLKIKLKQEKLLQENISRYNSKS